MTLQTALVGLGVTQEELLLGLMHIAPEGKLDQGMTATVKALVPAATESRVGSIIKALKAEGYARNLNGQGSNPMWVLHLDKFPAAREIAVPPSLTDTLLAMAAQSEEAAAESTQLARRYTDAAKFIELVGGDEQRALAAAEVIRENVV